MRTLEEEIIHVKEIAEINERQYKNCPAKLDTREHITCEQYAEEQKQLAAYLTELRELREERKNIRSIVIDEFVKEICRRFTEYEQAEVYRLCCCEIKQKIADIGEKLKSQDSNYSESFYNTLIKALRKLEEIEEIIDNANQWSRDDTVVKAQGFADIEKIVKGN